MTTDIKCIDLFCVWPVTDIAIRVTDWWTHRCYMALFQNKCLLSVDRMNTVIEKCDQVKNMGFKSPYCVHRKLGLTVSEWTNQNDAELRFADVFTLRSVSFKKVSVVCRPVSGCHGDAERGSSVLLPAGEEWGCSLLLSADSLQMVASWLEGHDTPA